MKSLMRLSQLAAGIGLVCATSLWAATDIANVPVIGGGGTSAKPNIMLLMDTSNSMSWTHMPDEMEVPGLKQLIGYKNSQCNSLYYNPNTVYRLPRDAANATLPMPNFYAAPKDYYSNPSVVVDLSTSFQAHDASTVRSTVLSIEDVPQAAYHYTLSVGSGAQSSYSATGAPCIVPDTGAPNTEVSISAWIGTWNRKLITATSGTNGQVDERPNFAIWYTYYRTRMALAKSAIGMAFAPLDNKYRVGFLNANPTVSGTATSNVVTSAVQPERYQKIADFDPVQKVNWFSKLYGQYPDGSSPTREGLARVGRHYAGRSDGINQGMVEDPVQQACQSNYTIVTTDGYWNTVAEKPAPGGGPTNIAGDAWVGEQDRPWTTDVGLVPFGVYDGNINDLGYTDVVTRDHVYSLSPCMRNVTTTATQVIQKSQYRWHKTVTTPPPGNATALQKRTIQYQKRTWHTYQTTVQLREPSGGFFKSTVQSVWYDSKHERDVPVASCAGYTSDCTTTTTPPVAVSSCVAASPQPPNYLTVVCTSSGVDTAVPACLTSACYTSTVGPIQVQGDQCWTDVPSAANGYKTYSCTIQNDVTVPSATCPPTTYTSTGNTQCYSTDSGWNTASSCSDSGGAAVGSPPTIVMCQSVGICVPSGANLCAPTVTETYGGDCAWSATTTCYLELVSGPVTVDPSQCVWDYTPTAANGWLATYCFPSTSAFTVTPSCTPSPAVAPNWTATICGLGSQTVAGVMPRVDDYENTTRTYANGVVVGPTLVHTGGWRNPTTWLNDSAAACVDPAGVAPIPAPYSDPVVTTTFAPPAPTAGSFNSLADVAQYYYANDLRPGMPDLVPSSGSGWGDDKATWQHMTTFVVGLGVSGTVAYQQDYPTAATGAFSNIRRGTAGWPVWPDPALNYAGNAALFNDLRSIDDFWHTAVNGRGRYFSANNPDSVVSGIRGALTAIDANGSAGSSVVLSDRATSTLSGLNYFASYITQKWTGDIEAKLSTPGAPVFWSARSKVDGQTQLDCDDRNIFVRDPAGVNQLSPFTWTSKNCATGAISDSLPAALKAQLNATSLSQYSSMTTGGSGTVNQVAQANGSSLLNYLRGQRQAEGFAAGVSGKLYRTRDNVLGDIINSQPVYVAGPARDYVDSGYTNFKSAQAARQPMIYAGGNDGMLHAFYAPDVTVTGTALANAGKEAWAYVPTQVFGNLSTLADINFASNHRYFVDGTPVEADVRSAGVWRTILVGGLNGGGKGYYALDVTDPSVPKSLWEFSSSSCTGCDVGLSFGKPVITKLKNGTWVVILTTGYNNASGVGAIYILDAVSGNLIRTISTGAGTAANPSGLAHVGAYASYPRLNNTALRVYGGDLLGNIWRFDVNDSLPPAGYDAKLIGVAKDSTGAVQSITTVPDMTLTNGVAYVYVGTGRLLGVSDLGATQQHSVYAIADNLNSNATIPDLRATLKRYVTNPVDFTLTCVSGTVACATANPSGWMADLTGASTQVTLPLTLVGDVLQIATTTLTNGGTCSLGGISSVYFADAVSGETIQPGLQLGTNSVADITLYFKPGTPGVGGVGGTEDSVMGAARDVTGASVTPYKIPQKPRVQGANRASWRELVQQ